MPIYEYRCAKCGAVVEILHSIQDRRAFCAGDCAAADHCGDGPLERIVSQPAKVRASLNVTGKIDYDRAAEKGFTTFRRSGKGNYERIAGQAGPATISVNDD